MWSGQALGFREDRCVACLGDRQSYLVSVWGGSMRRRGRRWRSEDARPKTKKHHPLFIPPRTICSLHHPPEKQNENRINAHVLTQTPRTHKNNIICPLVYILTPFFLLGFYYLRGRDLVAAVAGLEHEPISVSRGLTHLIAVVRYSGYHMHVHTSR